MTAVVLYSGGKDSTRALELAIGSGLEIECLLTAMPEKSDSYMFHPWALELVEMHSRATRIPLRSFVTSGEEERELEPLQDVLAGLVDETDVTTVVAGALRSNYQKKRIEDLAHDLGLDVFLPLWGITAEHHLEKLIDAAYEIVIVAVATEGMDACWLGRTIDGKALEELTTLEERYGINIDGEGGEYETAVLYAPIFRGRILLTDVKNVWEGSAGHLVINKCQLVNS